MLQIKLKIKQQFDFPAWKIHFFAALILLSMFLLLIVKIEKHTPVIDEPYHAVRGMAYWWTDSARLSYAHPPLSNALMAAPSAFINEPLDFTKMRGWKNADHIRLASHLSNNYWSQMRSWIITGRICSVFLSIILAAWVYLWAYRRYGVSVGILTLIMLSFNPTILAHGQLFTTDMPITLLYTLLICLFINYIEPMENRTKCRGWNDTIFFGIAIGAALATKYSVVIIMPLLMLIGMVWSLSGWGRFSGYKIGVRLLLMMRDLIVVALLCILIINISYRFEDSGLSIKQVLEHSEPRCYLTYNFKGYFLEKHSIINALPEWFRIPLPYTWIFGIEMIRGQSGFSHPTWFMGSPTLGGDPLYFPLMLLIKTPILVWVGIIVGICVLLIKRKRPSRITITLVLLTCWFVSFLMPSKLNIGVRHALPVVPILTLLSAIGFNSGKQIVVRPYFRRIALFFVLFGLTSLPLCAIVSEGKYIQSFSVGSSLGHKVSMIGEDWGQDVGELADAVVKYNLQPFHYVAYGIPGVPELKWRGISFRIQKCRSSLPSNGWVAIHAATALRNPNCLPVLTKEPDMKINEVIWIYKL